MAFWIYLLTGIGNPDPGRPTVYGRQTGRGFFHFIIQYSLPVRSGGDIQKGMAATIFSKKCLSVSSN